MTQNADQEKLAVSYQRSLQLLGHHRLRSARWMIRSIRAAPAASTTTSYANLERRTGRNQWIELTLTEGKNREVRNVLEHLGLEVSRLMRTASSALHAGRLCRAARRTRFARRMSSSSASTIFPRGPKETENCQ